MTTPKNMRITDNDAAAWWFQEFQNAKTVEHEPFTKALRAKFAKLNNLDEIDLFTIFWRVIRTYFAF